MNELARQEILDRYEAHSARFDRMATLHARRYGDSVAAGSDERVQVARKPASAAAPRRREGVVLTRRERQILALLADGLTTPEMAANLCITEFTVKSHVKNLSLKLGARNRHHTVALALRRGLVE